MSNPKTYARIIIEGISPVVDGGQFPAKAINGEPLSIEADLLIDGHGMVAAKVSWREAGGTWSDAPMTPLGNDRYGTSILPRAVGLLEFRIVAWNDLLGAWQRDVQKKLDAGVATQLDAQDGVGLLCRLLANGAGGHKAPDLSKALERLPLQGLLQHLNSIDFKATFEQIEGEDLVASPTFQVRVDRPLAGFGAWYEIFPRSQGKVAGRHGTFKDCEARLSDIRAMGFDVLYLTPIHPIGRQFRKGRNNALKAGADDPGSPYAIGAAEGGHKDILPELGTLPEFRRFVRGARDLGLEVALDFAVQCSPDHPYVKAHPEWFKFRADGSIAYAENPPKKYQDIVNLDLASASAPTIWDELRSVVFFWIEQGVTIFRVDNPHTKPFAFWQWLIAEVHRIYPEVIFLSEAFTRPKVMYYLAKIGFTQSYTYFTWRTSKTELIDYLTELSTAPVCNFFRPNFFPTTPDIFPHHLHNAGRPGFMARVALAALLAGNYGVYSGYELCEGEQFKDGEEYRDSEKYEIKVRDWDAPGNIKDFIVALNRVRNEHPVMRDLTALRFFFSTGDSVLFFARIAHDRSCAIFAAVNLDPHHTQESFIDMPLEQLGLASDAPYRLDDLLLGHSWEWTGKRQHLLLDPDRNPVAIFRWRP